jgi:mono/diheme cytochrome c family protein
MTLARTAARLTVCAASIGFLSALAWIATPSVAEDGVIDMEAIFTCEDQTMLETEPCNAGRELFLSNCTACHNFVQVVLRQYDPAGWDGLMDKHRDRVSYLTDEERETITNYLAAKFNPDRDPPQLPQALLEDFTDY